VIDQPYIVRLVVKEAPNGYYCTSIDSNVDIAGCPWDAMDRQRLGTHHEKPHMGSEQCRHKIQEIRFHNYRVGRDP
jgi:hypothetical protein